MRISDWSSDVCSSDLPLVRLVVVAADLRVDADTCPLVLDDRARETLGFDRSVDPPRGNTLVTLLVTEGTYVQRLIEPAFTEAAAEVSHDRITPANHLLDRAGQHRIVEVQIVRQGRSAIREESQDGMLRRKSGLLRRCRRLVRQRGDLLHQLTAHLFDAARRLVRVDLPVALSERPDRTLAG